MFGTRLQDPTSCRVGGRLSVCAQATKIGRYAILQRSMPGYSCVHEAFFSPDALHHLSRAAAVIQLMRFERMRGRICKAAGNHARGGV